MDVTIERGAFSGLYSYEIVLLLMGVGLFLIGAWGLIRQIKTNGSLLGPLAVLPFVLLFVGYPSVKAVQFDNAASTAEALARTPPDQPLTPEQKAAAASAAATLEARAKTPQTQALAANAYRASGEIGKAYGIAQAVLAGNPSANTRKLLIPVLTAQLEKSTPPIREVAHGAAPVSAEQRQTIATVASQLQAQASVVAQLPATAHVALARAYVTLDQPQNARSNIVAAQQIDPNIKIGSAVLHAAGSTHQPPGH